MNSIAKIHKSICTGCGLCATICPHHAIGMMPDEEGFLSPIRNEKICTDCGLCLKGCPVVAKEVFMTEDQGYFCCTIADETLLMKSSSGGVFGLLANHFLQTGDWVCGCLYDDSMTPIHILTNQAEIVEKMYGSKYVQSQCFDCFPQIKEKLEEGNRVLFTGTACQVAALRGYLHKEYSNLFTAEILCHGVPSPELFKKYVAYLGKKLQGQVLDVQFRNKERDGWGSEHRTCVIYRNKNGKICKYRPILPAYFSAFFYGLNLRLSCYTCHFATPNRVADITLGDYWGFWRKYGKRFDKGISVVSVNSKKGKTIADIIKQGSVFFDELTQQEAMWSNDNFNHPVSCPPERNDFYKDQKQYRGIWEKTYFTKTYRKKTLQSLYGCLIPAKIRFAIQKMKRR